MKGEDAVEGTAVTGVEAPTLPEGFVLEEIEMRGFMRYLTRTDPSLRFPEKFTVITGRTGAGKSSILDAITFALYGSTTRTDIQSVKITDVCRPGGYVRVAFRQGDGHWTVKRGLTSRRESYLEVTRDGDAVQGTIHEKERTIRDVVGLDYTGFRNSTFVRQEEMKELGSARGAERLGVFQKLFRLEIFERALERARELDQALQGDVRARDAEIAVRAEGLRQLPAVREQLRDARAELTRRRREVAVREARVRDGEEHLKGLEAQHEGWVKANAALEDRLAQLEGLLAREKDLREQSGTAESLEAQRAALEKDIQDLDALREEAESLKERRRLREQRELAARSAEAVFAQAKRDHERKRDEIKDKIDRLHRKIAGLRTSIDRDAAFGLLRDEGRLEERVDRIGRELEWLAGRTDLVRSLYEERARAEKALDRARSKVRSIDQDSFVLTEFRGQLEELKADLKREADESHVALRPLDEAKIEALRQLDAATFTEDDVRRVETIGRLVQEKTAKRRALDGLADRLRRIGDVPTLLADLENRRKGLEEDRSSLEADVERRRPAETAFQTARESLERDRAELDRERREMHVLEGRANQLAAQVESLQADEGRMKEAERQRDETRLRLELYDLLVNRVFHKKGVVMYAIDQLLPELEIEASKNLVELTDGRFSRIRLETYEEGRGHGIRIKVHGVDGQWHDVGEFSGGEKTQINAALRFAIAKELASMPQIGRTYGRMKTLFIDEGDLGSLDTEVSRELFVQKLFRMGEFFEKVILITHLAEIAEKFPGRIRVTMTPEQESRLDVLA